MIVDVAVVSSPDPVLGERICAVVVPRVGDSITLAWVSLALGLSGRRAGLASLGALARVLFLPWLVVLITVLVVRGVGDHGLKAFLLLLWFVFTVTDICFGGWAMTRLKRNFRGLAAQQSARVAAP